MRKETGVCIGGYLIERIVGKIIYPEETGRFKDSGINVSIVHTNGNSIRRIYFQNSLLLPHVILN